MPAERKTNRSAEGFDPSGEESTPEGWVTISLGCVTAPSKERVEPTQAADSPYVGLEHIEAHTTRLLGHAYGRDVKSTKAVFRTGDVLYGKLRPYLSKVCIAPFDGVASTDILVFPRSSHLDSRYLLRYLSQPAVASFANHRSSGVQLPRIAFKSLAELRITIPPLVEQHRIAEMLEVLLGKLSMCRDRLDRIPAILARFRQAVLAAACSGNLTEEWREGNQSIPPMILKLQEKRSRLVGKGSGQIRNVAASVPDANALPEIPDTWAWAWLPELGELSRGKSRHRPRNDPRLFGGPYPFVQTGDIARSKGRVVSHGQAYNQVGLEQSRLWPTGTVCITIAANIAESALLTYPACFPDSVVGLIADPEICVGEYAEYFVRTARTNLAQYAPATAQANINLEILRELAVPLPPAEEQRVMVQRISELLGLADAVERRALSGALCAQKLAQSILGKAFHGELVPTEAELAVKEGRGYETAEELLGRVIFASEESRQLKVRPRRRKAKDHEAA